MKAEPPEADSEVGEPEPLDPDVCATIGCDRPAVMTYLQRPRCQECYEDDVAEPGDETKENAMKTKQKKQKKATKTKVAKAPKTKTTKAKAAVTRDEKAGAAAKKPKAKKVAREPKPKRVSALDAAAQVLAKAKEPMGAKALVEAMAEQGLWTSPAGKTPHATLYAAMLREERDKGSASRFKKVDRGLFEFAGKE